MRKAKANTSKLNKHQLVVAIKRLNERRVYFSPPLESDKNKYVESDEPLNGLHMEDTDDGKLKTWARSVCNSSKQWEVKDAINWFFGICYIIVDKEKTKKKVEDISSFKIYGKELSLKMGNILSIASAEKWA